MTTVEDFKMDSCENDIDELEVKHDGGLEYSDLEYDETEGPFDDETADGLERLLDDLNSCARTDKLIDKLKEELKESLNGFIFELNDDFELNDETTLKNVKETVQNILQKYEDSTVVERLAYHKYLTNKTEIKKEYANHLFDKTLWLTDKDTALAYRAAINIIRNKLDKLGRNKLDSYPIILNDWKDNLEHIIYDLERISEAMTIAIQNQ